MKKLVRYIIFNFKKNTFHIPICFLMFFLMVQKANAQCPDGDVHFINQQQVDDFATQYPNCTEISGHLIVARSYGDNTNIDNLQALANLTSIEGNLHIGSYEPSVITSYAGHVDGGYFGGHPDLTNLSGLENLETIGGDLLISNNNQLTSISPLSGLDSIGGNVSLYKNNALTSLDGLANLTTIHGDLTIGNIESSCYSSFCQIIDAGNNSLVDFSDLQGLTSIEGTLSVVGNNNLTSLTGLENIQTLNGLTVYGNDALTDFTGLENLETIVGHFSVAGRYIVIHQKHIDGFLETYFIYRTVHDNFLTSFNGLDKLTSIGGSMTLAGQHGFTNFSGLEMLTTIGGSMIIGRIDYNTFDYWQFQSSHAAGNNGLTDFSGLENLNSIGVYLDIVENHNLINVESIDNIQHIGGPLRIHGNSSLYACNTVGICNRLADGGDISIYNNATGCNSNEEVEGNCVGGDCPSNPTFSSQEQVDAFATTFPNCTEVGDMVIFQNTSLTPITDLMPLSQLTSVNSLTIENCSGLSSLAGLEDMSNIQSYLTIENNSNLANLNGLGNATLAGDIHISENPNLSTLAGLENVDSLDNLTIIDNTNLLHISALQNLNYISNNLNIHGNNDLLSFTGLSNLTSIGSNFMVYDNYDIDNFSGLNSLTTIGNDFIIYENPNLTNFSGLSSLTTIGNNFTIYENPNLANFSGLNSLTNTGGLLVYANAVLADFGGLDNLTSIGEILKIGNRRQVTFDGYNNYTAVHFEPNPLLTDITALSNLNYVGGLGIYGQDSLSSLAGLNDLDTIGGNFIFLENNGINDFSDLENLKSITGDFMVGVTYNLFSLYTPYYTEARDTYHEGNHLLSSFSGLENLNTIGGDVTIANANSLTTLSGLENLQSIGGDFNCYRNNTINNLSGLEGLNTIEGNLNFTCRLPGWEGGYDPYDVESNAGLIDLTGLDNLTTIDGFIRITENHDLTDLSALDNLDYTGITNIELRHNYDLSVCSTRSICDYLSAGGSATLEYNDPGCNTEAEIQDNCVVFPCPQGDVTLTTQQEVESFAAQYPDCTKIMGDLYIGSTSEILSGINDLNSLSQLTSVQGDLVTIKNAVLTGLDGLENLTAINGNIYIGFNAMLSNLADWNNLTSTGGNLVIRNNALSDLSGFNSLTSIGSYINIGPDSTLTSLAGLENLTSINGDLLIHDNIALSSLNGLDNINHNTITNLKIINNPQLNVCDVNSVCNYLGNGGTAEIMNNASGCNTQVEVQNNCGVVAVEIPSNIDFIISPNPSKGIFQLNGIPQGTYQIHDTTGRIIQSGDMENNLSIDISQEARGVYFISIQIENETITKRIIKM